MKWVWIEMVQCGVWDQKLKIVSHLLERMKKYLTYLLKMFEKETENDK